jgi:hypothetical protein
MPQLICMVELSFHIYIYFNQIYLNTNARRNIFKKIQFLYR